MQTRKIFRSATIMILALLLVLGMASVVGAQGPWPWGQLFPWPTTTPWPTARPLVVGERFSLGFAIFPATPVPASSFRPPANLPASGAPAPVAAPSGDSPASALTADGGTRTLGPGASAWYKVGNGGDRIEVFLDANPLSGVTMSVFAPGNLSDPIGQGTLQKSSGRLVWAGGHWTSEGVWMARVTNGNPMAVQYTLTSTASAIGQKNCYSYWETYPTGQRVYWTECQK